MEEDVKPEDEDGVDGRGVGRVCGLGVVGASLVFGLVRGSGAFAAVLPSFGLVSRMPFAQRYRGNATSFSAASSCNLRHGRWRLDEGFGFSCRFGCQWGYHRVWIVRVPIALVDVSRVDLLFVVR